MAKMLAMPIDIEKKCRQYCDIRKIKEATLLRLLVLKKVPVLHNAATLNTHSHFPSQPQASPTSTPPRISVGKWTQR